jgi:uncharacterized protein YegP (UPF0339 family)
LPKELYYLEITPYINGKFYFSLKAANNQIIGNSQMYASESGSDKGIESVIKNGK